MRIIVYKSQHKLKRKAMNAYQKHTQQQIESVLEKARTIEKEFPATKSRLLSIVEKLKNGKPLSENDFETIKLNKIDF